MALLAAVALSVGACTSIDAITLPSTGPCEIMALDPGDTNASFASDAACVIVAWDTTRFPSALVKDNGIGDPVELRAAAEQAGY